MLTLFLFCIRFCIHSTYSEGHESYEFIKPWPFHISCYYSPYMRCRSVSETAEANGGRQRPRESTKISLEKEKDRLIELRRCVFNELHVSMHDCCSYHHCVYKADLLGLGP